VLISQEFLAPTEAVWRSFCARLWPNGRFRAHELR
jgi:hypothetical protein